MFELPEFARLTKGKAVGKARAKGKWLCVPLEPGYVLLLGECGVVQHLGGACYLCPRCQE